VYSAHNSFLRHKTHEVAEFQIPNFNRVVGSLATMLLPARVGIFDLAGF